MSRIFISYRRQDSEGYVGRLYDHLTGHFGPEDIFMDVSSIEPGVDFVQVLEQAVAACDVLIAVIGPQWLTISDGSGQRRLDQWNDFVRIEIASALRQGKLVIPALVGAARMPSAPDLPEDLAPLARRNAVELSHQRFAYDVERLVTAVKNTIAPPRRPDPARISQKEAALRELRDTLIKATDSPLYALRTQSRAFPVLGEGSADASILFIGESPGPYEAREGRPFCGPSGDVLEEMLNGVGLKREDVYLTNLLLDSPQEKREPLPEEIAYYAPFVDRLIEIIQPAVIVTLGRFAMQYLLRKLDLPEKRGKISELHGRLILAEMPHGQVHVVPLYHPAVVLYSASQKETLRKDFEKLRLFV